MVGDMIITPIIDGEVNKVNISEEYLIAEILMGMVGIMVCRLPSE